MPGHQLSTCPTAPGTKNGQLHMDQGRGQWIGRFVHDDDKKAQENGSWVVESTEIRKGSHSKVFGGSGKKAMTEHEAFQDVVGWLWSKWQFWQDRSLTQDKAAGEAQEMSNLPAHIQEILATCQACQQRGPCNVMKILWGNEARSTKPQAATSHGAPPPAKQQNSSAPASSTGNPSGTPLARANPSPVIGSAKLRGS